MYAMMGDKPMRPRTSLSESDETNVVYGTIPQKELDTYSYEGLNYYNPEDPEASQEARADNQGYVDIIGKGLANIGVSVLKNVAEAPAYLATIATSPLVGIGTAMSGGNGWEAMGTYVFNNKYLETVQGIKDSIDENVLKIYVPPSVQEGGLWDKFTSMQNMVSQGSEMMGFVLSMYVPGAVVGKLGWGTKLVAGLNAAEAVGDVGLGTKAFNMLAKNFVKGSDAIFGEAGIGKILAGEARAGTVTGEALGIATNVDDAAKLAKGTAASAEAVVSNLDAAKQMLVYTNNAARATDTGLAITFNTTLESASEATQSYRDIYDAAKAKGYSEQDARNAAASGATNVFGANMSILAVTNILGEKFILDGFERAAKGADNNKVAKMIINDAIGDKTSNITELLKHNWFNQSKFGKTLVGKALEPAAKVAGKFAIGAIKEGVVEEGMQTNVSQVAKADALKGEKTFQREGLTLGSSSILTFINGISNYGTLFSEKGNQELAESIIMGGIFAGAIEFGGGAINTLSGETKKANAARKAGYDDLRNNFIYSFKSHNEYFQREPEKNTDGTPNPKAGKLILDPQGRPVLTAEAEGNMKKTEAVRLAQAAHADIITALDPDSVEAEFANFMLEYNVFVDMLSREGGSELMKQAIDGGHLEALIAARYKANNEGTEIEPAMLTSMVSRWKTLGKKTEDQLNFIRSTHSPAMHINYDKNDPKEVDMFNAFSNDMFNERLSNLALHEHVKQVRTTRMKSYEDAVKESAELQTKMDALSFNGTNLTPEQIEIKTEYEAAQKMFDDYEKQKPLYSDILSEKESIPKDAASRVKIKYDKIKNKQKIANQGGFTDELTQDEIDFMDTYDKDTGKSQIDAANTFFATAKEVKKINDTLTHAYTKTNSERKLTEMQISAAKEAVAALEKDFETLNNTELGVAKKYKLVGPEFKTAWDKYKADKLKESQQAEVDAKDAADMEAKTDGELASAGFDKDMRASIINHLISSGTAVSKDAADAAEVVFKDLEFTLNTAALQQEYNTLDKTTDEAKRKLREIETLTKLAAHPGGWAIVMIPARDDRGKLIYENNKLKYQKHIISKRKAKYVGKVNDREATQKNFPLMFNEKGDKLDEQEVANKREALLTANTTASIAQAAALVDQAKKFTWTTKDKTVERHMEISVSNDTVFYSKAEVQKHISKFNPSSDYYSNINADGSERFEKDAKGKATKRKVDKRNARMQMDPDSIIWDEMVPGFGPTLYVGRISKRSLVLSMAPINKNIVLASNKMKEAVAQRAAMVKALEDVRKYNTNLAKSTKNKTAALQTRLNDLPKVQNALTELMREARLLTYEIEGLTIKIANIEVKKSGFKKQDGKFAKNAQSDIDKLNILKEEKAKRLDEIPAIQQSLETEINNAIANIDAIKKQIEEHQQEAANLVAYNDAAGLLISTLKSLSEEDIYKLDPSNINSLLTSEGKDLLDAYYQQVKEDLTNKLIVNKTVDRIVIDKENELKIYNDSKQEFEKQLSNRKTFNEKLKAITTADVTSDTVDTLNNLLVTYLQIYNNTQYLSLNKTLATSIKDSTVKYIRYIEDLLVDIGHDRVIPNFNNAQVAQLKLRLETTLDRLRSIAVAPTVVEAYSSLANLDNYPASVELQQAIAILGKQIENYLDIDESLTSILRDLTAIYDFTIDLTKDTKKEIRTKIEATIKNIVDSRKEAEKIDIKIKDKITGLNSSIDKVNKELQALRNAATTSIDFETGAIKTANDEVVIENFRDLYLAELKAAKLAELSDVQKVAGDLQDPIKTTLDDLTKQRKQLEKELLQSILSNKEVTATKKLTSFLQLIPQFENQFNSDTAGLLQTVRAVFSRSKNVDIASTSSDKKDEEVLASMLNPSTAVILLNRYIADFNVTANSENQMSLITEAEYKAVVATFIDALDAGTKASTEGVLTKLRTTITSIDRVQSIAVDLASKLIVDMDRFSADIARRTQVTLNKVDRDNGDATYIDDEEIRVEGDDIAEYRQNRLFSTASSTTDTARNIGANEQIDDGPKNIRADAANPNEYTISIAVHGEHYIVEKEDKDKEAVYAPIELPKPPDGYDPKVSNTENDTYKKKLELYYNAEDLSGKGLSEEEISAITEFRRYTANNRFFTWTDANETIHKNIAGKKLFFRAATYANIKAAAKTNPDLQSIIDDIDNQLKLALGFGEQQTANKLQGLISGDNVILIPYEVVPGVNGGAPIIKPVKGLSSTEKRFNASLNKNNSGATIEPKVVYSSRPLADTVYKSWNNTDRIVTAAVNSSDKLGTQDFDAAKTEVETKLDIELVAPSSMVLDDKEISALTKTYGITTGVNNKEIKISYTLDGGKKELVISNTQDEYKILHAIGRDALKLSVIGGILKKVYTAQTKALIIEPQGDAYLQITKINRGVPVYAQKRIATSNSKQDLKSAELTPVYMPLSEVLPNEPGMQLVVVTRKNTSDYPNAIAGDLVVLSSNDLRLPVVTSLFSDETGEAKTHKANMLDVLGLTILKAVETEASGSLEALRESVPFSSGKVAPVKIKIGNEEVDINGYGILPTDMGQSRDGVGALNFYLNFGKYTESHIASKERNQIYIGQGDLVFVYNVKVGGVKTSKTTRIKLSNFIKTDAEGNKYVNLPALFEGATSATPEGRALIELEKYLNSKRINVHKKLLESSSNVTYVPAVKKDAKGNITTDSTLQYKQESVPYSVWAAKNIVRTNHDPKASRRTIQRNLVHDTSHITAQNAAELAANILKAEAAKEKERKEKEKENLAAYTAAAASAKHTYSTLEELKALLNTDVFTKSTLSRGSKAALKGVINLAKTLASIDSVNIATLNSIGIYFGTPAVTSTSTSTTTSTSATATGNTYSTIKELLDILQVEIANKTVLGKKSSAKALAGVLKINPDINKVVLSPAQIKLLEDNGIYEAGKAPLTSSPTAPLIPLPPPAPIIIADDPTETAFTKAVEMATNTAFMDQVKVSNLPAYNFINTYTGNKDEFLNEAHNKIVESINELYAAFETMLPDTNTTVFADDDDGLSMSRFKDAAKKTVQLAEAKRNMAAIFGQKFADEEVSMVVGLIQGEGYGAFTGDGKILLSDLAETSTEYHEAFHRVWRMYIPTSKRAELIAEFETRADKEQVLAAIRAAGYKGSREYLIEEALAEEFKLYSDKYKYKNGKLVPKNAVERWFDKLIKFLRALIGRPVQQQFYDDILAGKYKNAAPRYAYKAREPVYSKRIAFKDLPTIDVSSADINTINTAITVALFQNELAKGNIHMLLNPPANGWNTIDSYTKALVSQGTAVLKKFVLDRSKIVYGNYKDVYGIPATSGLSLGISHILSLINNDKLSATEKYYLVDSTEAVLSIANNGNLELMIKELVKNTSMLQAGEQKTIANISEWTKKSTAERIAYFAVPGNTAKAVAAIGSIIRASIRSKLTDDPAVIGLNTINNNAIATPWPTLDRVFSETMKDRISPRAIDLTMLSVLQKHFQLESEKLAPSTEAQDAYVALLKVESYKNSSSFYVQWTKAIANIGGKLKYERNDGYEDENTDDDNDEGYVNENSNDEGAEAEGIHTQEDEVVSKDGAYDKLVYEKNPLSSITTLIKLLIKSIPQKDARGNNVMHPTLGVVMAIPWESTINKFINSLANTPTWAMWNEFEKFVKMTPEVSSILKNIEEIKTSADKSDVKVKLNRAFGNHIYDFLITLITKDKVVTTSANSNTGDKRSINAWKNNMTNIDDPAVLTKLKEQFDYAFKATHDPVLTARSGHSGNVMPIVKTDELPDEGRATNRDKVNTAKKYAEYLGITLDSEIYEAEYAFNEGKDIYDTVKAIYLNAMEKMTANEVEAVLRNPTQLANKIFGSDAEFGGTAVGTKIEALARKQAKYSRDVSQSITSNNKKLFAANLNSAMTVTSDGLNYISSLEEGEINNYIQAELNNKYQEYYGKEDLLTRNATTWLEATLWKSTSGTTRQPIHLARTKLMLLKYSGVFNSNSVSSVLLQKSIAGSRIELSVLDSIKNTMVTVDATNIDNISRTEIAAHNVNLAAGGIVRVIQHADRSMAYGIKYDVASDNIPGTLIEHLEAFTNTVLNQVNDKSKKTTTYTGKNIKNMATPNSTITPQMFGVLEELVIALHTMYNERTASKVTFDAYAKLLPGMISKYTSTEDTTTSSTLAYNGVIQIVEDVKSYIGIKQTEFRDDYVKRKLHLTKKVSKWNAKENSFNDMYVGRYISTKEFDNPTAAQQAVNTIINKSWAQMYLGHIEEVLLFSGNADLYGTAENMFKRMSAQSSTGIVSTATEEFLNEIVAVNRAALSTANQNLKLDAVPYTSPTTKKNFALVQEVIAKEEEFTNQKLGQEIYDAHYSYNYDLQRLLLGDTKGAHKLAHDTADRIATNMAKDFRDNINENDGQSWLNIFAYRQYLKSVDKWSARHQQAFDFEMLVLNDMIRVKDNIAKGLTSKEDTTYTPFEVFVAQILHPEWNILTEDYAQIVAGGASFNNELIDPIAFVDSINEWLTETREGFAPLKPQYTGPVWLDENHKTVDSTKKITITGIRKTSYDVLLPSMLRGKEFISRRKFADLMLNMHSNGIDVLHMESAAKSGTKTPIPLWNKDDDGTISTLNDKLYESKNHTYLEWQYMKDQQNIDTEQKSKLKDSTQARKNMLANQTHRGVPIDFPMYTVNENGGKDYMKEDEWKAAWDSLSEQEKLDSSALYTYFAAVIEVQNDLLLKAVQMLEEELKINNNNPVEVTEQIIKVLREAATKRESSDNILNAIESIIDHGWIDVLPNRNTVEPILMSLVSNNLIAVKRFGNAVPQLASTGMDIVGTTRENNSATAELKTYQINQNGETTPAEIITVLPKQYQKAVLAKYSERAKRPITLFEAVEMLNEDMARDKAHPDYMEIEIFALRIPNQQMSSNDVFKVKQFYIGTKENFVYVPADIVVKVGSDFDIDKLQMYFPNMDKDFNEIKYEGGASSLANDSKIAFNEFDADSVDINDLIERMIANGTIEKEDCTGSQNAEDGAVTANFTPGGRWKTVEKLEGPSHKEGGIDLQINKEGRVTFKNASGAVITAAAGLVVPGGDKDKEVSTNPTPLAPVTLANSGAKGPETWKYNSETEEYIAPMLKEVEIIGKKPSSTNFKTETEEELSEQGPSRHTRNSWKFDKEVEDKYKIDWYETLNYKKWGLYDYSDYSSFNSAFRNAREAKEKEFVYKDKRYNTKLISKDQSDLYWESKKFLKDYYENNNFAGDGHDLDGYWKNYEEKRAVNRRLEEPYYFSITDQKPSDMESDGYVRPKDTKIFLTTTDDQLKKQGTKGLNTTYVHELSHKADTENVNNRIPKIDARKLIDSRYADDITDSETLKYLSKPTEIEARKMATLFYLHKNNLPYTNIDKSSLDNMYAKLKDLPYDIAQLLKLYDGQQEDLLKYLNNDFSYLNKKDKDAKK